MIGPWIANSRQRQSGSSLLEVMIAILVLAIGMLGIAALQAITLKNTDSSAGRSNAVIQSYAMLDMMRANREAARAGQYDQGWLCEPAEIDPDAANARVMGDVNRWIVQLQQSMGPSACGQIDCGANECTVEVRWDDSRATGGEEDPETLETVSRL